MRGESTSQIRGAGEWGWLNPRTISIEYNGFGRIRYMCSADPMGAVEQRIVECYLQVQILLGKIGLRRTIRLVWWRADMLNPTLSPPPIYKSS